ncbi:SPOR domain-containing protein [Neptunicoccus cionae]|uniref:Sporulation protein n=1 Tax=Neptunicoccus cionae TaxID=2035344 RepID=A0A916R0D2_9RHOB|nr:SPOR domain-containing protein [Amylibacter cionae]GGA24583.1 sporulation protein [Amylibacter cionae]
MSKKKTESKSQPAAGVGGLGVVRTAVNWGVAGLSVAVIGGFVYWTVSLGTRDPHDVPIIRAMVGPSRVAPADPGGMQASHQGLAVNSVQAEGGVAAPANTVVLAPEPARLRQEDLPAGEAANVTRVSAKAEDDTSAKALNEETDIDVEIESSEGEAAEADLDALEIAEDVAEQLAAREQANVDPATIPRSNIRGTQYSPSASSRPQGRPRDLETQITRVQPTSSQADAAPEFQSVDSVPVGTRLIQLGAYDSAELAKADWLKLLKQHNHLLEDKKRLVIAAKSGGRKFYRLRAAGFDSLDESRALCSALLAVGTPCIPVTAR